MAWVYVENGVVMDRVVVTPHSVFHAAYADMFIEAPDEVTHWWTYDGTTFVAPAQPSQDEVIAKKVADARAERNRLLSETDWTQAKDVPDSVSTKWAPYRQALRDVPQQAGFPDNIQWPSKPE
jgi:hypothetical protein